MIKRALKILLKALFGIYSPSLGRKVRVGDIFNYLSVVGLRHTVQGKRVRIATPKQKILKSGVKNEK